MLLLKICCVEIFSVAFSTEILAETESVNETKTKTHTKNEISSETESVNETKTKTHTETKNF